MGTSCAKITKNQLYDACNRIFGGVEAYMFVFNRDDIDTYVRDATNPNIVRGITMKTGAKGFRYEGYAKSIKPVSTGVKKEYGYSWRHSVNFLVLANSSEAKQEIEALAHGYYVVIVVNKKKTTDAAIEILGTDVGLTIDDGATRDPWDTATEGAYNLTLSNSDGEEEPHLPASFAVLSTATPPAVGTYDYAATLTALNALITPVV